MTSKAHLSRLGLFDARVPRYTSYPTAPQFKNDVDDATFTRWLREIQPGAQISLYVHVPFCRRLCWFCACRTQGTSSQKPLESYLQTLLSELDLIATRLPDGVRLARLHWGGGTPTILTAEQIHRLSAAIQRHLPLTEDAEFSVEIDPNEIGPERLTALIDAGMNRASIGIQDFDPRIQKTIGREQSFDVTSSVVNQLRHAGISSINADLVYGLPHQSIPQITETIQKVLSMSPDRIALYGYAHVPWMAKRQQLIPGESLPDSEARLELFEAARKLMLWDGYQSIGIDHFARPGDGLSKARQAGALRRNFQGYTDDPTDVLIGIGASSISRLPQGYAQNTAATSAYRATIDDGRLAISRGHRFQGDDLMRGRMIESLMCSFQIDADEICHRFDITPATLATILGNVNAQFDNLLHVDERGLKIPRDIRPLTRMIASRFDAYAMNSAGHSPAV